MPYFCPDRPNAAKRLAALATAMLAMPLGLAQAVANFPYVAYVIDAEAVVRSGPNDQFFPTARLPLGYAVEVYRHDADGMCAVRPPEGSFSVIPLASVQMLDERTAEVIADGVAARIGSQFESGVTAVQVLLGRGEVVELLDAPQNGQPNVRIAPPSGEFRWISARHISRTPPVESSSTSTQPPGIGSPWRPQNSSTLERSSGASPSSDDALALLQKRNQQAPPSGSLSTRASGLDAFAHLDPVLASPPGMDPLKVMVVQGSPAELQLAQYRQNAADGALGAPLSATPGVAPPLLGTSSPRGMSPPRVRFRGYPAHQSVGAAETSRNLADLELLLSQSVVRPPSDWQLAGLREEASAQLAVATETEVRAGLRDLLERIAAFERVQKGYTTRLPEYASLSPRRVDPFGAPASAVDANGSASMPSPAAGPTDNLAPTGSGSPTGPGFTSQSDELAARIREDLGVLGGESLADQPIDGPPAASARFDVVGRLRPVVSQRPGAPQFALVDDQGAVLSFLTPSPNLNLQAYLGQRIGVVGQRDYMPEYRQSHVVAGRVTPLEGTTRR